MTQWRWGGVAEACTVCGATMSNPQRHVLYHHGKGEWPRCEDDTPIPCSRPMGHASFKGDPLHRSFGGSEWD